jgi:hypothetical protein
VKVEGIGVGKKAQSPCPLQREDHLGDLPIFRKDVIPNGEELLIGNGEIQMLLDRLKKLRRGYFPYIEVIDDAFLKVEEEGKYSLGILKFFALSESGEFFCDLVMVEREDDITEIEKNDFNGRGDHFIPSPHRLPSETVS